MQWRLVKIIATLGPASASRGTVEGMIGAGVDAFRINMSHGDEALWSMMLNLIRDAERSYGKRLGLIADLEGPRVRLGNFNPIRVEKGDIVEVSLGNEEGITIDNPAFFETIDVGDRVLIDDGKVTLQVESVSGYKAKLRVIEGNLIEPRKGVAVSGKEFDVPPVTDKDRRDLEFVAKNGFSHVMVSYARDEAHIETVREILDKLGGRGVKVLAKIETPQGVRRARELAKASDGVVIARGDLGMHYPLEEIPVIQSLIIEAARSEYKPVILATELLSSMVDKPIPTRSEVVDVYEGVRAGVDALLLTSETAIGKYPLEVVKWCNRIIRRAQSKLSLSRPRADTLEYRLAHGIVELVESLDAKLVIYSQTGTFPVRISAFRPRMTYYAGVPSDSIERALRIVWGVEPMSVGSESYEEGLAKASREAKKRGYLGIGDVVVEAAWEKKGDTYIVKIRRLT
ncbi:MAG: pyruvate kinase [Desulfurococcales archaeon]|nr:pyruvate kinase [Desulfurococcales archaeon]